MARFFVASGSFSAALCIVLGAFGAHALTTTLSPDALAAYQTGVQYHVYHSLGLILLGLVTMHLRGHGRLLKYAGLFMLAGIVLFSGSLYGLSLTSWRWLGPMTPFGGLAFILAWIFFGVGVLNSPRRIPTRSIDARPG